MSQIYASDDQSISCSFSISPSKEYLGLISFRIDWFDLLAVQGTLKHLLQPHNSKALILQCSAFFMVQLSHPFSRASLVAQLVKNLPAMRETWVLSLGQEDSPGEGNGNPLQYSCLENPMDGGAWWATQSMGSQKVGHD